MDVKLSSHCTDRIIERGLSSSYILKRVNEYKSEILECNDVNEVLVIIEQYSNREYTNDGSGDYLVAAVNPTWLGIISVFLQRRSQLENKARTRPVIGL